MSLSPGVSCSARARKLSFSAVQFSPYYTSSFTKFIPHCFYFSVWMHPPQMHYAFLARRRVYRVLFTSEYLKPRVSISTQISIRRESIVTYATLVCTSEVVSAPAQWCPPPFIWEGLQWSMELTVRHLVNFYLAMWYHGNVTATAICVTGQWQWRNWIVESGLLATECSNTIIGGRVLGRFHSWVPSTWLDSSPCSYSGPEAENPHVAQCRMRSRSILFCAWPPLPAPS